MTTTLQILLSSSIDGILGQESIAYDKLQKLSQKLNLLQIEVRKRALNQVVQPIKKSSLSKICSFWHRNPGLPGSCISVSSVGAGPVNEAQIEKNSKPSKPKPKPKQEAISQQEQQEQAKWREMEKHEERWRERQRKMEQEKVAMETIKKLIKEREDKIKYELKQKRQREEAEMTRNEETENKRCILPLSLMNIVFGYYEYNDLLCDWSQIDDDERYPTIYSLWTIYGNGEMYKKVNSKKYLKKTKESLEFGQKFSKYQIQTLKTLLIGYQLSHKKLFRGQHYKFNNHGKQIAKWYNINVNDYNIDQYEIGKILFLFFRNELKVEIPNDFLSMEKRRRW